MTRTTGPKWPKGYSIQQSILLNLSAGGAVQEGLMAARVQAGCQSAGGEQLCYHLSSSRFISLSLLVASLFITSSSLLPLPLLLLLLLLLNNY